MKKYLGRFLMLLGVIIGVAASTSVCSAQTDITSTVTALSGYWTAIAGLAITVVLFVLGRRMLRKL